VTRPAFQHFSIFRWGRLSPELVIGSFPKNGYIKPLLLPLPVIKSNGRKARVVCFERRPRPAGSRGNRKLKDKTGLLACQKRQWTSGAIPLHFPDIYEM
jgi:hypothetical protein